MQPWPCRVWRHGLRVGTSGESRYGFKGRVINNMSLLNWVVRVVFSMEIKIQVWNF